MSDMFGDCMAPGGAELIRDEARQAGAASDLDALRGLDGTLAMGDTEIENLASGGIEIDSELSDLIRTWVGEGGGQQHTGNAIRVVQRFLPKDLSVLLERALRDARRERIRVNHGEISGDETDSSLDEEGHERTANMLFGGHLNLPESNMTPDSSPMLKSPNTSPYHDKALRNATGTGSPRLKLPATGQMTPLSSPVAPNHPLIRKRATMIENTAPNDFSGGLGPPIQLKRQSSKSSELEGNPRKKLGLSTSIALDNLNLEASKSAGTITVNLSMTTDSKTLAARKKTKQMCKEVVKTSAPLSSTKEHRRKKEKEVLREERVSLSQKLSLARPDLVKHAKSSKRPRSAPKTTVSLSHVDVTLSPTAIIVPGTEPPVDQERSRALEKQIRNDIKLGKRPTLPTMKFVLDRFSGKDPF